MTEAEWLTTNHPPVLLWFLKERHPGKRRRAFNRKARLLGCACCRRVWSLLGAGNRGKVEIAERYADGLVAGRDWEAARKGRTIPPWALDPGKRAAAAASGVLHREAYMAAIESWGWSTDPTDGPAAVHLLRDVFGNPFRPVTFSPEWCTDTAVSLARQMYESHDFSAMPILADALQDAGCDNGDILSHCRDANQLHVRGCWVVDLVLGKE
jgi:hypothetical protein